MATILLKPKYHNYVILEAWHTKPKKEPFTFVSIDARACPRSLFPPL